MTAISLRAAEVIQSTVESPIGIISLPTPGAKGERWGKHTRPTVNLHSASLAMPKLPRRHGADDKFVDDGYLCSSIKVALVL
jgi:hypothetical protein